MVTVILKLIIYLVLLMVETVVMCMAKAMNFVKRMMTIANVYRVE